MRESDGPGASEPNLATMPFPMAGPYRLFVNERRTAVAVQRVFDVADNVLRYLTAGVAAERFRDEGQDSVLSLFERPLSLGSIHRWVAESLGPSGPDGRRPFTEALREAYRNGRGAETLPRLFDRLIEARNRTRGHGITASDSEYTRLRAELGPLLSTALRRLEPLSEFRLVVVKGLENYDGVLYHHQVLHAQGDNPLFPAEVLQTGQSLPFGRAFLIYPDQSLLPLFPLLLYEMCPGCREEHLFLFQSAQNGRPQFVEPLRGCVLAHVLDVPTLLETGVQTGGRRPPAPAVPTPPPSTAGSGSLLAGRYLLTTEIGAGSGGRVWRAVDRREGRPVAVKVMRTPGHGKSSSGGERGSGGASLERFQREIRATAALNHRGIVRLLDFGEDGGAHYFVMELIDGPSLRRRLQKGPLPLEEVLKLGDEILDGLGTAHRAGIVHRDIKPENVLLGFDSRPRIADFGVAWVSGGTTITSTGEVIGTVGYMAPEQLEGAAVDARADLFSVGVLLFELATGSRPFDGPTPRETIARIFACNPVPPSRVCPGLPENFDRAVLKLLSREPANRPRDAEEARRILTGAPGGGAEDSTSGYEEAACAELSDGIEKLDEMGASLRRALENEASPIDFLVAGIAAFSRSAQAMLLRVGPDGSLGGTPFVGSALARSAAELAREVDLLLSVRCKQPNAREELRGARALLRKIALLPALDLVRSLDLLAPRGPSERERDGTIEFGDEPDTGTIRRPDWVDQLLSEDDLIVHEAILSLCSSDPVTYAAVIRGSPEPRRTKALEALWQHADLLLLHGRSRSRPIFDLALEVEGAAGRWRLLFSLFRRAGDRYWDPEIVRPSVVERPDLERRVIGRCLLLHPWEDYRQLGFSLCEPSDFWEVITQPDTPIPWLLSIWKHLRTRFTPNLLKVFLVCVKDSLACPRDRSEFPSLVALLQEFFEIEAFHEDSFFKLLMELDEKVKTEASRHGVTADFDEQYVERLKDFLEGGRRRDNPIEGWSLVPLPIQRKIARRGYFLRHFICHPVSPIALECLPHLLLLESVTTYVSVFGINGQLLVELAREKKLFLWEEARLALVSNPKTPAYIVMKHIGYLRKDSLRKLSDSHEVNQLSRQVAVRMLNRTK